MTGQVNAKVALITGAARGMGRSHAVRLAAEGADIIAVDICGPLPSVMYEGTSRADLDETVRLVIAEGRRIIPVVADVRDLETLRSAIDAAVNQLGRLDIVVANAGICRVAAWNETTPEIFKDHLDTNVTGVWNTVVTSAPHLVKQGSGSIILISSAAGLKAQPFLVHYVTSKFAVTGMTKAFAAELAQHSIRVNSIHPTGVDTPMTRDDLQQHFATAMAGNPNLAGMFTNMLPTDGVIDASEVSNAVLFLASDESTKVTALAMTVDAGTTQY